MFLLLLMICINMSTKQTHHIIFTVCRISSMFLHILDAKYAVSAARSVRNEAFCNR